jgi:hypothetical protein
MRVAIAFFIAFFSGVFFGILGTLISEAYYSLVKLTKPADGE